MSREDWIALMVRLIPALVTLSSAIINAKAKAPNRKPRKKRKKRNKRKR